MPVFTINLQLDGGNRTVVLDLDPELPNEKTILKWLQNGSLYEPDVSLATLRILREGDLAVDVGANVGFFTTLMGTIVGAGGRVVSIEPDPHSLLRLRNNLALNQLETVSVIDVAASDSAEEVCFYLNSDDSGGNALWNPGEFPGNLRSQANPQMIRMQATTIDAEIERLGSGIPRLIKIDTEGAEHRVLAGARTLLTDRKVPFIIAELHEFGLEKMNSSQQALRQFMEGFGYSTFGLYFDGALPKLIPAGSHLVAPHIINILFSTPEELGKLWPTVPFDPAAAAKPRQ